MNDKLPFKNMIRKICTLWVKVFGGSWWLAGVRRPGWSLARPVHGQVIVIQLNTQIILPTNFTYLQIYRFTNFRLTFDLALQKNMPAGATDKVRI